MQDYFILTQAVLAYIESHIDEEIEPEDLERRMCVSYSHLRDLFKKKTNVPLGRYIVNRRIANAAYDLVHTKKSATEIALSKGFKNPDTFTRSFRRVTGYTPSEFRTQRVRVGRTRITNAIYGPGIQINTVAIPSINQEDFEMEKIQKKESDACVLYGVHKVYYRYEEITPFPACLRSVLNYLGQDIDYCYLMAATGAAFRQRWNTTIWDGGNVDIRVIYEDPDEAFRKAFVAAGRSFSMVRRDDSSKEDFISVIRNEIDAGRPVIALGIIGPPEACIITGYRNRGNTLLGWNFFQEMPEFSEPVTIDECGYFSIDDWWENPSTSMLMTVGEKESSRIETKDLLQNALYVLTTEKIGDYAGGPAAFHLWAEKLLFPSTFSESLPMPEKFEQLMCHSDSIDMLTEGRAYAHFYFQYLAGVFRSQDEPDKARLAEAASEQFNRSFEIGREIGAIHNGSHDESGIRILSDISNRRRAADLITKAANSDAASAAIISELLTLF
ncbi:MAG: helix-turn-helix domain-containing protein [Clostridiaceae bacterium]|nr:helix-turn-helix domain-containing protein [Clostridiaceae bacterium]